MQIEVGSILDGEVTKLMPFGAFVSLGEGKSGLIHISQVSDHYVKDLSTLLKVGQKLRVKVLTVENGKIALTLRFQEERKLSFEDMMASFKKSSDEKISDLRRQGDQSRRSGAKRK